MKKLLAFVLILALFLLVSCAPAETPDEPDKDVIDRNEEIADPADTADEEQNDIPEVTDNAETSQNGGFTVAFADGRTVELGADAASIEALGEYTDMFEAPSCVHEGFDRVYTYDGFSVTTSPDENGADYVAEVAVESSSCALENGLTVGSTVDDMAAAYGEDYTDSFGFITYELEGATASFVTDGGVITSIVFTCAK